jgi:hypothetical protein
MKIFNKSMEGKGLSRNLKQMNKIFTGKQSFNDRSAPVSKQNILDQINSRFTQYSCKEISIQECLSNTSYLTADLLMYHTNFKIPRNPYEKALVMIANYYAILHMDLYTGFHAIDRNYIFNQVKNLSDQTIDELTRLRRPAGYDVDILKDISHSNLAVQMKNYYDKGPEGCLKHLARSIYAGISFLDKNNTLNEAKIEEVIRSVQAEKFFNSFDPR